MDVGVLLHICNRCDKNKRSMDVGALLDTCKGCDKWQFFFFMLKDSFGLQLFLEYGPKLQIGAKYGHVKKMQFYRAGAWSYMYNKCSVAHIICTFGPN